MGYMVIDLSQLFCGEKTRAKAKRISRYLTCTEIPGVVSILLRDATQQCVYSNA